MKHLQLTNYLILDNQQLCLVDQRTGNQVGLSFAESAVLHHLVVSQHDICTKDELLAVGWPERVVAPSSLIQCISTLRKKLEAYPEFNLKTVARRGYQLVIAEDSAPLPIAETECDEPLLANHAMARVWQRARRGLLFSVVLVSALALVMVVVVPRIHASNSVKDWLWLESGDLAIGNGIGQVDVLASPAGNGAQLLRWQRHFSGNSSAHPLLSDYRAFALTDGQTDSIAICPDYGNGCPGKDIVNISFPATEKINMDLPLFFELAKIMEQRIRYNRIELPVIPYSQGELTEHMYSADLYFPRNDKLLVRVDHNISVVYKDDSQGLFFASFCVTDQDCKTSPIKYDFEGEFVRFDANIGEQHVDVFKVITSSRNLHKPEVVTPAALPFYRELRRQSLSDDALYFYRFYQDEHSAAWVIPFYGHTMAWMKQSTMSM
ncbi:winged helix-turn-helix domain-containing protein [uncultured Ferrimonas sp.]|uniref:winged helix-turn-helix domain-containing protein n=1 Tax=uncultured Ferrimonas sp. TaxID=432640 RepID=UPI002628DF5D|nr:winged helix-turn-helix domain-containing protein [uncultured Ferrimonas sp.]